MLSDSASDLTAAIAQVGEAVIEWKLDGARVQVHRSGERVAIYTRNLNDVTSRVPEVVHAALTLPAHELILDGEVIALPAKDGEGTLADRPGRPEDRDAPLRHQMIPKRR